MTFHVERETLSKWTENVLIVLTTLCIVGTASRFDQWMTEHKPVHLEFAIGFLVTGCSILSFWPNRAYVAAVSFGLVAALGVVNALISRNLVAMPLISVSAIAFIAIVWWKASRESAGK